MDHLLSLQVNLKTIARIVPKRFMDRLMPKQKQRNCRIIQQKGIKIEDSAMNQIRIIKSCILRNIIMSTQGINLIPTITIVSVSASVIAFSRIMEAVLLTPLLS